MSLAEKAGVQCRRQVQTPSLCPALASDQTPGSTLHPDHCFVCVLSSAEQVGVPWRTCCLLPAGGMNSAPAAGAANVTYFISAERISHNFAPGGLTDRCTGEPLDAETMV